mmetsp:Transcript_17368/g.41349  ORF Transcript_17368/g.41349 Transcript_17368/m.41349 type:complete len:320 (-) Transcript_17368:981-1940(-)
MLEKVMALSLQVRVRLATAIHRARGCASRAALPPSRDSTCAVDIDPVCVPPPPWPSFAPDASGPPLSASFCACPPTAAVAPSLPERPAPLAEPPAPPLAAQRPAVVLLSAWLPVSVCDLCRRASAGDGLALSPPVPTWLLLEPATPSIGSSVSPPCASPGRLSEQSALVWFRSVRAKLMCGNALRQTDRCLIGMLVWQDTPRRREWRPMWPLPRASTRSPRSPPLETGLVEPLDHLHSHVAADSAASLHGHRPLDPPFHASLCSMRTHRHRHRHPRPPQTPTQVPLSRLGEAPIPPPLAPPRPNQSPSLGSAPAGSRRV